MRQSVLPNTRILLMAALALPWLGGCASTRIAASWADPAMGARPLAGATVWVGCRAPELSVRRLCQDQWAARLRARGLTPVPAEDALMSASPAAPDDTLLVTARAAGAGAVLLASMAQEAAVAQPGPSVSFGFGGFGGSWGGGGAGAGIGVSMPIGGAQVQAGYAMEANVRRADGGGLLWSAKASAAASADIGQQLAELTRVLDEGAAKAALY